MVRGRGFTTLVAGAALMAGLAVAAPAATAPPRRRDRRDGARRARRGVVLRPGQEGLRGHGGGPGIQGLVHRGRRGALRRLRADDRQHRREHAAVHRDRRGHVHRPADPGHDLHGRRRPHRHGLHRDLHRRQARLPAGHHLHHRPGERHRPDEHQAAGPARVRRPTWPACTCTPGSTPTSTATAAAAAQNAGANSGRGGHLRRRAGPRWSSARTRSRTPPTGITRCRPTWPWRQPVRAGGERRLRGHRQRRPHPAGRRAHPDRLHLRAGRPHRGHRGRDPGPRPRR